MEKIEGFCVECGREINIVVEKIIKSKPEIRYIGRCKICEGYVCRIISGGSPKAV